MDINNIILNKYVIGFFFAVLIFPVLEKMNFFLQPLSILIILFFIANTSGLLDFNFAKLFDQKRISQEFKIANINPGSYLVSTQKLNVRLAQNTNGKVLSSLKFGEAVEVFESQKGFSRITPYFDGAAYGQSGSIAQWVASMYLKENKNKAPQEASRKSSKSDLYIKFKRIYDSQCSAGAIQKGVRGVGLSSPMVDRSGGAARAMREYKRKVNAECILMLEKLNNIR